MKRRVVVGGVVSFAVIVGFAVWPRDVEAPAREPEVEAGRYVEIPKIDVHVHVPPGAVTTISQLFREHGVEMALNASGGTPGPLLSATASASEDVGGRMPPYCHLQWERAVSDSWEDYVRAALGACVELGAVGLKIFKALGLGYLREDDTLMPVDDPRLDLAFELAGELGLPVLIHSGDPKAFFEPATEENERFAELSAHPGWSFHGEIVTRSGEVLGTWPAWAEVVEQFERRVARHPGTTFVGAHFGNAPEEPDRVERMLDTYPNLYVETGARIPEIGRHDPERMRRLFVEHRERILFGTDFQVAGRGRYVLGSMGDEPDDAARVPAFYEAHWRYFETRDRGFAHPTPIQGDWSIDGIGVPREVLEDVYFRNAARVFGLRLPEE